MRKLGLLVFILLPLQSWALSKDEALKQLRRIYDLGTQQIKLKDQDISTAIDEQTTKKAEASTPIVERATQRLESLIDDKKDLIVRLELVSRLQTRMESQYMGSDLLQIVRSEIHDYLLSFTSTDAIHASDASAEREILVKLGAQIRDLQGSDDEAIQEIGRILFKDMPTQKLVRNK